MKIRLPSRYPTTLRPGGPTLRDGVWVIQKDPNDLQRFENFLRETKECLTVDTETKGHNVRKEHARYKARATSAQISCEEFPRIYIDNYRECEGNILLLKWWAENAEKKKDGHNIKYEGHVFANHGIRLRGVDCDTIVCDYLLDTSREGRHDLETALYDWGITDTILPGYSETFSWHPPKKNGEPKKNAELKPHYEWWDEGDHDRVIKYATKDVFYGRKLRQHHEARLRAIEWVPGKSYWDYYRTIDLPMLDVLLSIELEGAPVDQEHLLRLQEEFGTEIAGAEREFLHRLAEEGVPQEFLEEFNLGSPQQLGHVLYDILGYECPKWTGKRPGEGQRSVDEVALNLLVDKQGCSILEPLFKAREYGKLHSTYAVALYDYAQEYRGRVHTNLNQIGTATMRLSSSKPNLQNIPTRTKLGKEIRKAFIAPPGEVILCADYSQIELRVAAHKSGDPTLVRYFMEGKDPHALTGYNLFEEIRADIDSRGWDIDTKEVQKYIKTTYDELRGRGKCFHPDTEVLTRTGWKKITDLQPGEEVIQAVPNQNYGVRLEWVVPLEVFTAFHPSGELVHLQNEGMDLRVTPDHRMLMWKERGSFEDTIPENVPSTKWSGWANAGLLSRSAEDLSEHYPLLRAAVATQADGHYAENGTLTFGFSKERKILRFREVFTAAGLRFTESEKSAKGVVTFRVPRGDADRVKALLDAEKRFPWWWLSFTQECREVVLDEVSRWDGSKRGNWRMSLYVSSEKQNVEVLQAIASLTGRKSRLVPYPREGERTMYHLSIRDRSWTRVAPKMRCEKSSYTDRVACLAVPSSYVLVRDGGVPVITGQTWNFMVLYGGGVQRAVDVFKVPEDEAQEKINAFFDTYPGIRAMIEKSQRRAHERGYITTIINRRCHLPNIHSMRFGERKQAERQATNYEIQGSAQDIIKMGMIVLHREDRLRRLGYRQFLQIHDEVLGLVPQEAAEEARPIVEKCMGESYRYFGFKGLRVETPVEAGTGKNWAEAKH